MFIKNGHLPWCPTFSEPCHCKAVGYALAIVLAVFVAILEFWGSYESASLALLGDAWHVTSDVAVYVVAVWANVRANAEIKKRSARFNANLLITVALVTIGIALWRIVFPVEVAAGFLLIVATIGLVVNVIMLILLRAFRTESHEEHDHLHDTTLLHTLFDLGISVAVVVTGVLLYYFPALTAWRLDALVTIGICVLLIQSARNTKRAITGGHAHHHH